MHEYSVASELIHALLPQLEGLEGTILRVYLKKGELRILSDRAMIHAFEMLAEGTRLEGAELMIEAVPARVRCSVCPYEGEVERVSDEAFHFSVPILSCPLCGCEVDLLTGRELSVEQVSVQDTVKSEDE
jgi:hydrogenase nickel incorporation protein HypA/HybF